MQAGDHDHPSVINLVVQAIGEARQQEAADAAVDHRMGFRKRKCGGDCVVHGIDELVTQPRPL
jgi:hypothetical protein